MLVFINWNLCLHFITNKKFDQPVPKQVIPEWKYLRVHKDTYDILKKIRSDIKKKKIISGNVSFDSTILSLVKINMNRD